MRLAADTVRINVSTAPIYGSLEPERRAMLLAAEETVKSGYDKFIILNGQSGFRSDTLAEIPARASGSYGPYGGGFSATGPQTINRNRYQTEVYIKMFKAGDPQGANAVDAREVLRTAPKG
jgi:hypothetical protein